MPGDAKGCIEVQDSEVMPERVVDCQHVSPHRALGTARGAD